MLALLLAQPALAGQFEPKLSFPAKPGEKSVALTFDACAGGFDTRIFQALMDDNIKATIFVTERWLRHNGGNLKLLKSRPDLFQIENHGANHVPPVTDALTVFGIRSAGTVEAVKAEVEGGSRAVVAATGRRPVWYRGATARYSTDALAAIKALDFRVAGYSLNADKGASRPAAMVERRIAAARPGDVVIAHINQPHRQAGAGVAAGVRDLAKAGWTFVKLEDVKPVEDNRRRLIVEPDEGADRSGEPAPRPAPKAAARPDVGKPDAAKGARTETPPPAEAGEADALGAPPDAAEPGEARPPEEADARPSMQIKPRPGAAFTPRPDQRQPGQLSQPPGAAPMKIAPN